MVVFGPSRLNVEFFIPDTYSTKYLPTSPKRRTSPFAMYILPIQVGREHDRWHLLVGVTPKIQYAYPLWPCRDCFLVGLRCGATELSVELRYGKLP
jgi:hypothetical protein